MGKTPKSPFWPAPGHIPTFTPYKEQVCPSPFGEIVSNRTCCLFLLPSTAAEALVKPCLDFLSLFWSISINWGKPRTLVCNILCGVQLGAIVPFWGEDLDTSRSTECSFRVGDKWPPELRVSVSPHLVSLPSWPVGTSVPSFRQHFPQLCPFSPFFLSLFVLSFLFSSPEISLLLCPSLPLSSSDRVDIWQL